MHLELLVPGMTAEINFQSNSSCHRLIIYDPIVDVFDLFPLAVLGDNPDKDFDILIAPIFLNLSVPLYPG